MPDLFKMLAATGPVAGMGEDRQLLPDEYGTTIRCYDAGIDAWRVAWMAPAGREFVPLMRRSAGDRIVQEGSTLDGSSLERWTFSEVTPDSFFWQGESSPGGDTWRLDQELRGARQSGRQVLGIS